MKTRATPSILLVVVLLVVAAIAEAQQPKKVPRIGYLLSDSEYGAARTEAFRQALRELGYIEGHNIFIEYRSAEGKLDRLSGLAAELVHLNVELIVTGGGPPTKAAKNATNLIPIIMINVSDPVALGFVASLANPMGNITGFSGIQTELGGKRLELLKEVTPKASRVAILVNREVPGYGVQMKEVEVAAKALDVQLQSVEIRGPSDLESAFTAVTRGRAGALMGLPNPTFSSLVERIADLAVKNRLPSVSSGRFAEAGGLMSYGASSTEQSRGAALYVDKILKGARPAELPVQRATKFELIINLKTAKQIGLTIPPNVLVRADKVIK
jgi:ABC-type uncharacterized transport system substrate-binding protein